MLNTEINKTAASAETALKGSGKYGQIPFVLWKNVNQMTACSIEKIFDYVVFHRTNVLITSCSIEQTENVISYLTDFAINAQSFDWFTPESICSSRRRYEP